MINVVLTFVFFLFVTFAMAIAISKSHKFKSEKRRRLLRRRSERVRCIKKNDRLQQEAKANPKKDFDHRLDSFLDCVEPRELDEDSKADYWESPDLELGRDNPRSLGFIRYLLGRIYKVLHSSGKTKG